MRVSLDAITAAIKAVCPINGLVYIPASGDFPEERNISFAAGATTAKKNAAQALFNAWVPVEAAPSKSPQPFASAGVTIVGGVVVAIELAPQIASAYYEDGWMSLTFSALNEDANYLLFVNTDVPAKVEQFKDLGSFELVFSDPATGDPIEPGRIDLYILKVR